MGRINFLLFGTDIWSLLLVLLLQDLPFSIIRLLILIFYNQLSKNYTLYFFVIKNLMLAASEIYLVCLIIFEERKKFKKKNEKFEEFTAF